MATPDGTGLYVFKVGHIAFIIPKADAMVAASILVDAERVEFDWTSKNYKPYATSVEVEIKQLTIVQLAELRLAQPIT